MPSSERRPHVRITERITKEPLQERQTIFFRKTIVSAAKPRSEVTVTIPQLDYKDDKTFYDALSVYRNKNRGGKEKIMQWDALTNDQPLLHAMLTRAAMEIGKPVYSLTRDDFLNQRYPKLGFSLIGLYKHFSRETALDDIFEKARVEMTLENIQEALGHNDLTAEEVLTARRKHKIAWRRLPQAEKQRIMDTPGIIHTVSEVIAALDAGDNVWERVRPEVKATIITGAAEELGVLSPMLYREALDQGFAVLKGHRLTSWYEQTEARERAEKPKGQPDVILAMLKDAEVTIDTISNPSGRNHFESTKPRYVNNYPILTREQEQTLLRYRVYGIPLAWLPYDKHFLETFGDGEEKNRRTIEASIRESNTIDDVLVAYNEQLIIKIARTFPETQLSIKDLIEIGKDAFHQALDRFDPELGYRLYNVTSIYIVQCMQREIAHNGYVVPVPVPTMEHCAKIFSLKEAFEKVYDKEPTREELRQQAIANTNISVDDIESGLDFIFIIRHQHKKQVSFQEKVSSDDTTERGDLMADKTVDIAEEALAKITGSSAAEEDADSIRAKTIAAALQTLTADERTVIMATMEELPHDAITERYGFSGKRIKALLHSAYNKLEKNPDVRIVGLGRDAATETGISEENGQIYAKIREHGLNGTSEENYLAILNLREGGLTRNEVAERLGFSSSKLGQLITDLISIGLMTKAQGKPRGFISYLLKNGLISPDEVRRRKEFARQVEPRGRAVYKTQETEAVRAYVESAPQIRINARWKSPKTKY